jgi:hypothetical protein
MRGTVYWRCEQVWQTLPCSSINITCSYRWLLVSDLVFTGPVVVSDEYTVAGTGGEEASLFAMDIFRMSVVDVNVPPQ